MSTPTTANITSLQSIRQSRSKRRAKTLPEPLRERLIFRLTMTPRSYTLQTSIISFGLSVVVRLLNNQDIFFLRLEAPKRRSLHVFLIRIAHGIELRELGGITLTIPIDDGPREVLSRLPTYFD